MCGICGKFERNGRKVSPTVIEAMTRAIEHRGPDDSGAYVKGNIGLGHRRLSIIDLASGRQPITNEDRTIWVVYNGEIYNFKALRRELKERGHVFATQSDTEVIVHLYEEYGEGAVSKLHGMFAFALWDEPRQRLVLARDRVGIKPLYYQLSDERVSFGSEVKALLADPCCRAGVNLPIIDRFLSYYYVPGTDTLFEGIKKLPPASYMIIDKQQCRSECYWDIDLLSSTRRRTEEELRRLLGESVKDHMISDVPVGVLLSGGVDSTGLLSFAASHAEHPISTFTIGFDGNGVCDERPFARLAASRFGTQHYEMSITAEDFRSFLPKYVQIMEEPVCEPPAVALYYVSRLASRHVKVLISGEGGDEAFAGYPNYRNIVWFERMKRAAGPFRETLRRLTDLIGKRWANPRLLKYSALLGLPIDSYYYSRTSGPYAPFNRMTDLYRDDFAASVSKKASLAPTTRLHETTPESLGALNRMLYVDLKTWLPDDLLIKADKITMANSVELRVPLLDHRVLEFAASLEPAQKLRVFQTKHLLRKALRGRIPEAILSRAKAGFPVPVNRWLSTDLHQYACDVLLDRRSLQRGYFRRLSVARMLRENQGTGQHSAEVFCLLVIELWHRIFADRSP